MKEKDNHPMSEDKLRELFQQADKPKSKTEADLVGEWKSIKAQTIGAQINPPPKRMTYQLGAAVALIFLFFYSLEPDINKEEQDLARYLFEDSMPFEEESRTFIDGL